MVYPLTKQLNESSASREQRRTSTCSRRSNKPRRHADFLADARRLSELVLNISMHLIDSRELFA
jgi:hypothetical protein